MCLRKSSFLAFLFCFSSPAMANPGDSALAGAECGSPLATQEIEEKFCPEFKATPSLSSFSQAQAAGRACGAFYEAVIRGIDVACNYFSKANSLTSQATASASLTGIAGQGGNMGDAASLYKSAVEAKQDTLWLITQAGSRVERASYEFEKELREVGKAAERAFKKEVKCGEKGEPGSPAAFMLRGVVALAEPDRGKNRQKIVGALQLLRSSIVSSINNQRVAQRQAESARNGLGLGADGRPALSPSTSGFEAGPSAESTARRTAVQGITPSILRSSAHLREKGGFKVSYGPVGKAFPSAAKAVPAPVALTALVSISYRLVTEGSVDPLGLVSIGAGGVATIASGSPWVGLGVGLIAQAIEDQIRSLTPQGRAVKEYTSFGKTRLQANPGMTSSELASAFFQRKEELCAPKAAPVGQEPLSP